MKFDAATANFVQKALREARAGGGNARQSGNDTANPLSEAVNGLGNAFRSLARAAKKRASMPIINVSVLVTREAALELSVACPLKTMALNKSRRDKALIHAVEKLFKPDVGALMRMFGESPGKFSFAIHYCPVEHFNEFHKARY